jgi:hypothetical protein
MVERIEDRSVRLVGCTHNSVTKLCFIRMCVMAHDQIRNIV